MTDREMLLGVIDNYRAVYPDDGMLKALIRLTEAPDATDVQIARRLGIFQHVLWSYKGVDFAVGDEAHMIGMGL